MGDVLIVDGYNVIHYNEDLKAILNNNMNDARMRLMEILSNYVGYKGWALVVVFDAHQVKDGTGSCERYDRNTHIVFTGKNETADTFIEKMVHDMEHDCNIWVATSDKEQQYYVLAQGAIRISARELWQDISNYQNQTLRDGRHKRNPPKSDFLRNRVSTRVRERLEKLRRGFYKD